MKRNIHLAFLSVAALAAILFGISQLDPDPSTRADKSTTPVLLYCAAGIKPPVETTANRYRNEYGTTVQIQYGGSGTLLSSLKIASTGDLYLAADVSYLELARQDDLVREIIPLAVMKPVLAIAKGNPKGIRSIQDLLRPDVRVVLANPEAAAIGRTVKTLLAKKGLWDRVEKNATVFKPTVNEVANDLKLGAADVGVVWDATANQYDELTFIVPPEFEGSTRHVSIGVLTSSKQPREALRFARYLAARDRGLEAFAARGYEPVRGDRWAETPEVVLFSGGVNRVAIEDTLQAFEQREGVRVTRVYNGCGILVAQIKAGQKPDAYFACDVSFMKSVRDDFDPAFDIASTEMVLVTQKGNPKNLSTLADLTASGIVVGVANPRQSALGALTERLLDELHLLDSVMRNVRSQTPTADLLVNQIKTGALDAAIVYRANTSKVADSVDTFALNHPATVAIQPYAVGKNSDHLQLMGRLLESLRSEASRTRFEQSGFNWVADLDL